jgi:fatty acid desaturase
MRIWMPEPKADATFDPGRSWLFGEARRTARALAAATAALFGAAGILVMLGAGSAAGLAVVGALASLVLVLLTFHPWLLGAVAIDVAIAVVALK